MDKAESLRIEPIPDPKDELKSISLINMTYPSLEEAIDKINTRVTNPWEILDNKVSNECNRHGMMETMFSSMDIHEESTLELEKEDYINEHGSHFLNTSSNPCLHEKTPDSIGLSNMATHEIFNPLILHVHKDFERLVVDVFVYHKYCKSHCVVGMNLEIGTQRLVLKGKPLHQLEAQFEGFPKTSFCLKTSTFGR